MGGGCGGGGVHASFVLNNDDDAGCRLFPDRFDADVLFGIIRTSSDDDAV